MPYTAKERLYVNRAGKVYKEADLTERSEVSLLASEGTELSDADAERYGLTGRAGRGLVSSQTEASQEADATAVVGDAAADDASAPTDAKAVASPPSTKARSAPASEK